MTSVSSMVTTALPVGILKILSVAEALKTNPLTGRHKVQ